jgi:hypothetical protein
MGALEPVVSLADTIPGAAFVVGCVFVAAVSIHCLVVDVWPWLRARRKPRHIKGDPNDCPACPPHRIDWEACRIPTPPGGMLQPADVSYDEALAMNGLRDTAYEKVARRGFPTIKELSETAYKASASMDRQRASIERIGQENNYRLRLARFNEDTQ